MAIGAVRPKNRMTTPGSPKLGLAMIVATRRAIASRNTAPPGMLTAARARTAIPWECFGRVLRGGVAVAVVLTSPPGGPRREPLAVRTGRVDGRGRGGGRPRPRRRGRRLPPRFGGT